jgi:hypothetical protein
VIPNFTHIISINPTGSGSLPWLSRMHSRATYSTFDLISPGENMPIGRRGRCSGEEAGTLSSRLKSSHRSSNRSISSGLGMCPFAALPRSPCFRSPEPLAFAPLSVVSALARPTRYDKAFCSSSLAYRRTQSPRAAIRADPMGVVRHSSSGRPDADMMWSWSRKRVARDWFLS